MEPATWRSGERVCVPDPEVPASGPALPGFDLEALRSLLADPSVRTVRVRHRAGLLAHPRARALEEVDPSFTFTHRGSIESMSVRLKDALRAAGLSSTKAWEALLAEVSYLFRVFASLAEDPGPSVSLSADGVPAPSPSSRLALIYTLGPGGDGGPDTAILTLDPSRLAGDGHRGLTLLLTSEREPCLPGTRSPRRTPAAEVVLASLPFGIVGQPSLALSLLKSTLPAETARVLYLTMPFARRIGLLTYMWLAELQPSFTALLGEWIFGGALSPEPAGDARRYLEDILLPPTARWLADLSEEPSFLTLVPEGVVADVLRLREHAGAFLDDCAGEILALRPRVVGFTSVFQQHAASLALARRLKARCPEVAIVLGGSNCEGAMGLATLRSFDFVDAVVSGEGEVVFPRIVERVLAGQPLDGLCGVYTRTSPEVAGRAAEPVNAPSPRHLDDLPYPDFDDFFAQYEENGLGRMLAPKLLLETARGCWWGAKQHCTFCGLNGSAMAFRSKSPERALSEIQAVTGRHPGLFLDMADNILDMRYFGTLLPRLAEERLELRMFYEVKANLRKEQIRQLRSAGVVAIQPGIESLSDEVLRIMRKGVTALQNLQLLKWCAELGVQPYWNLIWGFPGEPPEEYARMAELLPLLHHLPPPAGMSRIFLERFSPNHFQSAEMGFAELRPADSYDHIYPDAADDIADLAYFFEYQYRDGRTVADYSRPLVRRIADWREAHPKSRLAAFDLGDRLLLFDSRPVAARPLAEVEGLARTLYLACDGIRTLDQLCRLAATQTQTEAPRELVEEILEPLAASGYLVRQGDFALALAIPGPAEGRVHNTELS